MPAPHSRIPFDASLMALSSSWVSAVASARVRSGSDVIRRCIRSTRSADASMYCFHDGSSVDCGSLIAGTPDCSDAHGRCRFQPLRLSGLTDTTSSGRFAKLLWVRFVNGSL